ncbi:MULTISPECIES: DUF4845 domain-containing protein [unclassified Microbulbifer]|uniref:DUF4845 domain-containing protein n=1 Tax=Microbulbifer spongiae TaxID=2944933 RepID=A0ABY9EE41_9GAMM|nr:MULTISPECIES: DUF4845 domain-containing protein [unclassified Microbulbifer]MDP5210584.1 DUF4845 domain-containing protein [Microbulbifer sp. 2205BS26-8]WKD50907.1 DUF4845 domain-containing protein [Microbulbifer sp. MI-G]
MGNTTHYSFQYQRGMSYWGWLLLVAVLGFVLTCASRMAPAYLDARYVTEGLKILAENPDLETMSAGQIKKELGRFFLINNVRGEPTEALQVVRGAKGTLVSINYELRQPLIYNVDVVMKFNKQLNTASPELCCDALVDLEQFRKRD